jgi:flagellum-specific ATP synthase
VDDIALSPEYQRYGRVGGVIGRLLEVGGLPRRGGRCAVIAQDGKRLVCEAAGFRGGRVLLLPVVPTYGLGHGCRVKVEGRPPAIYPHDSRLGEPIDGKRPLPLERI